MTIEELLNKLGYKGFRDMSLHTNGKWNVRSPKNKEGKRHMTSGRTPEIALQKMLTWYKQKHADLHDWSGSSSDCQKCNDDNFFSTLPITDCHSKKDEDLEPIKKPKLLTMCEECGANPCYEHCLRFN